MTQVFSIGTEAFDNDFELIPEDTKVRARIYDIKINKRPDSFGDDAGKPYIEVTYKIDNPGKWHNREIRFVDFPLYDQRTLAGKSLAWRTRMWAQAHGIKTNSETGEIQLPENIGDLNGSHAIITVGTYTQKSTGRTFNNIKQVAKGNTEQVVEDSGSVGGGASSPGAAWD